MCPLAKNSNVSRISSVNNWQPLIIAAAPNGARRTKADHPGIPMTPNEIAKEAAMCRDSGAVMIHLHVRTPDGEHSLDVDLYRNSIKLIRSMVGDDLIIQITTEAMGIYSADEQMNMVREVRPEAISTAIRELIPDEASECAASEFYVWAARENISVQYIIHDRVDLARFADLRKRGVIPGDVVSVLYVLGKHGEGQNAQPSDLLEFLYSGLGASDNCHWSICAFGPMEGACILSAISFGGHARVGMENNLYLNDGTLTSGNAALVHQVSQSASLLGRILASTQEARLIFSSPKL